MSSLPAQELGTFVQQQLRPQESCEQQIWDAVDHVCTVLLRNHDPRLQGVAVVSRGWEVVGSQGSPVKHLLRAMSWAGPRGDGGRWGRARLFPAGLCDPGKLLNLSGPQPVSL